MKNMKKLFILVSLLLASCTGTETTEQNHYDNHSDDCITHNACLQNPNDINDDHCYNACTGFPDQTD